MHILLTGGTGLIGRGLCHHWADQGHRLTVLSRTPHDVPALCGSQVRGIDRLDAFGEEAPDAVVNLAGAPIADRPWSERRKQVLRDSRIALTERLLTWLEGLADRPRVLISGSAMGWYGNGGEKALDEHAPQQGDDFAARLCRDWEQVALGAEALGMRVVVLRTGLVLGKDGGLLKRLRLPFRLGLGGPMGNGRQWMPWIHLADQIALIDFLLRHEQASGPYNACAPHPVRNREFAYELGHALNRPAFLPAPAFALRWGLGELSGLLLGGQRGTPARLQEAGFDFRFARLDVALVDLLSLH